MDPLDSSPKDNCHGCTESWANRSKTKTPMSVPEFRCAKKGSRDKNLSVNPVIVRKLPEYDVWSERAGGIHAAAGVEDAAQLREEEGESNRNGSNRPSFSADGALFDRHDEPV